MLSNRPYLIRALYDWILDSGTTPHLLVNADAEAVNVPRQFVEQGRIVLNISPGAVHELQLGNDLIRFAARFGGAPMLVSFPPKAVLGIYARENGRGMLFSEEEEADDGGPAPTDTATGAPASRPKPTLKVVK
jgi:stringent starvation protein B